MFMNRYYYSKFTEKRENISAQVVSTTRLNHMEFMWKASEST